MRGRGLPFFSGPAPMEQEVEVGVDRGLLLVPRQVVASPVVWASPALLFRLVLSLALLVFPCPAVAARVSSSLSTTHHVHHFHNKHGTVPIAINRMPFVTRGGHGFFVYSGKSIDNCLSTPYFVLLSTAYVFGSCSCNQCCVSCTHTTQSLSSG
ncbi:hypothetical protein GOODEAATRI_002647 [Goodea atripinnis]|uniref:Uncharacterized protein n=1 Tax=Goodea atripinnis TaxID=208336 RepID=A0ABV0NGX9_9TELE